MKQYFLLVDFGASNTKSTLVDVLSGEFAHPYVCASLGNVAAREFHYEVPAHSFHQQFRELCTHYANLDIDLLGVVLCSQMHGFILLDENHQPVTHYISWQDERAREVIDGVSSLELLCREVKTFKQITGMTPKVGLPAVNLLHLGRTQVLRGKKLKLVSLPEWIALCDGDSRGVAHPSMMAGSGLYDLSQGCVSAEMVQFIKQHTGIEITLNEAVSEKEMAGTLQYRGRAVPIYAGVGDHQCALLGAGTHLQSVSINIGTGSQIAKCVDTLTTQHVEQRPYFGNAYLLTQTHIPAGRALNEYVGFVESIGQLMTGKKWPVWEKFGVLTLDDVMNATLEVDLAVFQSASTFQGGGKIGQIREGSLTAKNFLASLIKNFAQQYVKLIEQHGWRDDAKTYILSGGIPRKLPLIRDVLACILREQVLASTTIDETLLGLRAQAIAITHNVKEYQEVVNYVGAANRIN